MFFFFSSTKSYRYQYRVPVPFEKAFESFKKLGSATQKLPEIVDTGIYAVLL